MYGEVRTSLKTVQLVFKGEELLSNASTCEGVEDDSGNCIGERSTQHDTFHITVSSDRVIISSPLEEHRTVFTFPSCLQLQPESCSSIDWVSQDGLHARIKVSQEGLSCSADDRHDWSIPGGQETSLDCGACGRNLTTRILKKMMPLPSDNWEGIMEELWCCRSKDLAGTPPDPAVTPATSECLVGTFEVVLGSSQLVKEAVVVREEVPESAATIKSSKLVEQVECSRCHSMLGTRRKRGQSDVFHLWKFKTVLSSADKDIPLRRNFAGLETLVAGYLINQLKNDVCFKFMLESENRQAQILLWLISPDCLLLWTEPSLGEGDSTATTYMDVHCTPIIKVLYKLCWDDEGKKLRDEWNHDMMVQSFILPLDACVKLAEILNVSTGSTPPSMRNLNNFTVGYLKTT